MIAAAPPRLSRCSTRGDDADGPLDRRELYLATHQQLVLPAARSAMSAGARRALLGAAAYVPELALRPLIPAASLGLDGVIAVYFASPEARCPAWCTPQLDKPPGRQTPTDATGVAGCRSRRPAPEAQWT